MIYLYGLIKPQTPMTATEQLFLNIREGKAADVREQLTADPGLLEARDQRGSTPLILATYLGDLPTTKVLVEAGAPLEATDAAGNTALMGVCFKGFTEVAAYLGDQGANVNARGDHGSALHFATMFNKADIVDMLLSRGADASAKDGRGMTAADHARQRGLTELAERLA